MSTNDAPGRFPPTAWTLLEVARGTDNEKSCPVLNDFIGRYWKPVFCFIRAKGYALDRAEDLTQEFMIHKLLSPTWIAKPDRDRGRFRNFLLKTLQGFLADQGPNRAPRQKTFEAQISQLEIQLGEEERSFEPATNETPETIFMRKWARTVVNHARQRVKQFYEDQSIGEWYELFEANRCGKISQADLGRRFGESRNKIGDIVEIVKLQAKRFFKEEVRDQVDSEAEVEDELRELLACLGASRGTA